MLKNTERFEHTITNSDIVQDFPIDVSIHFSRPQWHHNCVNVVVIEIWNIWKLIAGIKSNGAW